MKSNATAIRDVLNIAEGEVGVEESPGHKNTGARVDEYIRSSGYSFPVPWCLCFCYWCLEKAIGEANPVPRTGDCDLLLAWAKKRKLLFDSPVPGDIGLLVRGTKDAHHAFLVTQVVGHNVRTIEGNTNPLGGSEGYAVLKRTRKLGGSMLFIRWAELVPSSTQALLTVCGTDMGPVEVQHGVTLAPVRRFLTAAGIADSAIRWDADSQCVYVGNRRIPSAVTLVDNVALLPVRALAEFAGLSCDWNPDGVITCTPT